MFRTKKNPSLKVSITRADFPESVHLVDAAIVNKDGELVACYGDVDRPVFPRSAIKPMQAMSFVESHAVEKYSLSDKHVSLACASHSGDHYHTEAVGEWLSRLQLTPEDLVCFAHEPYDKQRAIEMYRTQEGFTRLHNNCSGKHAGILSTCKILGFDVKNYGDYDHPIQKRLRDTLSLLGQENIDKNPWGIDGCGIPTYSMSLKAMAKGMAAVAGPVAWHKDHAAAKLIREAMTREPKFSSGTGMFCAEIIEHTKGRVLVKTGAEGMCCIMFPDTGVGVALKAQDGALRAVEAAAVWISGQYAPWTEDEKTRLEKFLSPEIRNWSGLVVGKVIVAGQELG